jgi:hypothetical protein
MARAIAFGSMLMLSTIGCTALVETDTDSLGAPPQACDPGSTNPCPCPGGGMGSQVCNSGGSYDACFCDAPAAGVGGAAQPQPAR